VTTAHGEITVSNLETFRNADISSWLSSLGKNELWEAVEISSERIRSALDRLKSLYHGKDTLIDLLAVPAVAREPLLVLGPPGTGKSDLISRWCSLLGLRGDEQNPSAREEGYFEYLLTTFTEPNELFGPVDIAALREGSGFHRKGEGMLQNARLAFLDEIFRANSAILNSLLTILNERRYYEGGRAYPVPLITLYAASNSMPLSGELTALLDRFPLRILSESVGTRPEDLRAMLDRGWQMETSGEMGPSPACLNDLLLIAEAVQQIFKGALQAAEEGAGENGGGSFPCLGRYLKIVRAIRAEKVCPISDRNVVKLVRVLASAALLSGSLRIEEYHLWILLHVWERPEDREQLRKFILG